MRNSDWWIFNFHDRFVVTLQLPARLSRLLAFISILSNFTRSLLLALHSAL